MTERNLGNSFSWWIGEVVNVKDPDQSGRVQVRVYGRHDDKTNIKDDDLPWAMPLQPVTSAALGKIGSSPLGLLKGSKIVGYWADADQQYPIIMGSFGKAGDPKPGGSVSDGVPEIDKDTGSIPTGATNQSDPVPRNPYSKLNSNRITINDINNGLKLVDKVSRSTGIINNKEVDKKLKEPTIPTVASVAKGATTHILDAVKQVDPSALSSSLPNMVPNFNNVRNILSITSPAGLTKMLSGSIGKMVGTLIGQYGLSNVAGMMKGALSGLDPNIQKALKLGLTVAYASYVDNGHRPTPYAPPPITYPTTTSKRPPSNLVFMEAPDLSIEQYYTIDQDPYPGYIEWLSPTQTKIYTLRGAQPHYSSATEHLEAMALDSMLKAVAPSVAKGSIQTTVLAGALAGGLSLLKSEGLSKVLGKGVDPGTLLSLATKLLPGGLGGAINSVVGGHLPKSVLSSSMSTTLSGFTKGQAMLAAKKQNMTAALKPTAAQDDASLKAQEDKLTAGLSAEDKASVLNGGLTTAEKAQVQQSQIDATHGVDRPVIRG